MSRKSSFYKLYTLTVHRTQTCPFHSRQGVIVVTICHSTQSRASLTAKVITALFPPMLESIGNHTKDQIKRSSLRVNLQITEIPFPIKFGGYYSGGQLTFFLSTPQSRKRILQLFCN